MKRRIVIAVSSIILICIAGVLCACKLVNDKDEDGNGTVTLRPTVDIDKTTGTFTIGIPVQPNMKYVSFYRKSQATADKDLPATLISQCIVDTAVLAAEGIEVIQTFDNFTESPKPYVYFARYEADTSITTSNSYEKEGVGNAECELTCSPKPPVIKFTSNAAAKTANFSLGSDLIVPDGTPVDFYDPETTQICLALQIVGETATRLVCLSEMSASETLSSGFEKTVREFIPSYMYGKSIVLKGVVGMNIDIQKNEKGDKVIYTRRIYTKLTPCELHWEEQGGSGGFLNGNNGSAPIENCIFTIPDLDVKDPIDFY